MNKLFSLLRSAPKRTSAIVLMVAAAIIVPATLFAWGPSRTTYTTERPADHVTFNSITNNPVQGDERNFVQIRDAVKDNTTYADSISLTPGHDYVVYIYYHNNAASNLNASGVGIAKDAYVKASIPVVVEKGSTNTPAVGFVGASNSNPKQVWDEINFSNTTGADIALRYVTGSATIHNLGSTNGKALSDKIVTDGAALGYNSLDGVLRGCNEYAGYVTFRIHADQPSFKITKEVRKLGTTTWYKSIEANAGDSVEYRIQYLNDGTTAQNNVVISDVLPSHVKYVNGSTILKNTAYTSGKSLADGVTGSGVNIGNYGGNSNAYVIFTAKVDTASNFNCGTSTLTNTATVKTANGSKDSTADVTVNKECTIIVPTETKIVVTKIETPSVTPPELPHTGVSQDIISFLGLGTLVTTTAYYIASRRALNL
jgi:uncharacterized repeat protein (TIGR01451 family)